MKKSLYIILFLIFTANAARAVQFYAQVSASSVSQGDRLQVSFTIEGEAKNFKAPDFKGFSVLSGPNQSQNMSFVNGRMSSSIAYSYILQADIAGDIKIGPASVDADGKKLYTNAIIVHVGKGSSGGANNQQGNSQKQGNQDLSKQANDVISKNMFILLSVSKQNCTIGDQISVAYKLYMQPELQVLDIKPSKNPAFNGFWSQDFDESQKVAWNMETYNGVRYKTAVVKKILLIPQQSGKLTIDPIEFESVVRLAIQGSRRRSNDPFADFFNDPFFGGGSYKDFPYTVRSKAATINVSPIQGTPPAEYCGGIGNLNMEAWLDKTETKTNEPVTLKVKISGTGNLKLIDNLNINFPPDFENYEPKVSDNITVNASGMSGNKIFEYLLLPRNPGVFKLGPVKFAYYDLAKKQYVTKSSQEFTIKVAKGTGEATKIISGVSKEDVKYLGKDIRFIKEVPANLTKRGNSAGQAFIFVMTMMPAFLFILFMVYRKKKIDESGNIMLVRNRKATKAARKRLGLANKYMSQNAEEEFFEEVSRALWGYIADKLGIPTSDLTKDAIRERMNNLNVPDELTEKSLDTIDECEFARYAPASAYNDMNTTYLNSVELITKLEGYLR